MSTSTDEISQLIGEVRLLAHARVHRLDQRQLDRLESLTPTSIRAMRIYLEGRPVNPQVRDSERRARAAEVHRASDELVQARDETGEGRMSQRPAGRRPGTKVTEPGIYYFEKRVYKVIKSQYSGHLQARRLNPEAKTGKWAYIPGMMGVLRAGDKMTAEDSREFEELYGYPTCTDCGAPLENDLSRERRVGPVCWGKNGH